MQFQFCVHSRRIMAWLAAVVMSFGLVGCGDPEEPAPESDVDLTPLTGQPEEDPNIIKTDPKQVDAVVAEAKPELPVEAQPAPEETLKPEVPVEGERSPFEKDAEETGKPPGDDDPKGLLEHKLKQLQVPPAWLADVTSTWDVENKPWKDGRIEIRRLLGKGDDTSRREGIKLTWDYLIKEDIGNAHEYGMYLFLGNEPIWAVHVYREWVARTDHDYPPFFGVKALASLYADFGLFEDAEELLKKGLAMRPPKAAWVEMRQAEFHDAFGDLYAKWGKIDKAKASYREAVRMYPLGKPPYGRHLLPRRAKKSRAN